MKCFEADLSLHTLRTTLYALSRLCMYLFTTLQESIDLKTDGAEGQTGSVDPSDHFDPVIGELTKHGIAGWALDSSSVRAL